MRYLAAPALALALAACTVAAPPAQQAPTSSQFQRQSASQLQSRFLTADQLSAPDRARFQQQVQAYADEISRKRELDFFQLHSNPVGLELSKQGHQARILTYLGTARERTDLNVEVRLLQGQGLGLNLNYSGPVTRNLQAAQLESSHSPQLQSATANGFEFELITGLPSEAVVSAYADFLEGLTAYLRYRYQARPFSFDDGPLVYALHFQKQLQGFVFLNQRNIMELGERKYADLQSVVVIAPNRELLGAYTLVGFNPKTSSPQSNPVLQSDSHPEFGTLVTFGEY